MSDMQQTWETLTAQLFETGPNPCTLLIASLYCCTVLGTAGRI